MRRLLILGLMVGLIATPAYALRVAMPNHTTATKAATSDVVVVGKVTSIEADLVELEISPKVKTKHKVAVIKVETALQGAKNTTHIKVAFPVPEDNTNPGGGIRRPGGFQPVVLNENDEGIFFLVPFAPGSTMMKVPVGYTYVPSNAANYKDEIASIKELTAVMSDPIKALKAAKAEDRLNAAYVLSQKYRVRSFDGTVPEEVNLSKEESQLIVAALLEADWTPQRNPVPGFDYRKAPQQIASQFALYPGANGIPKVTPKPGQDYGNLMKTAIKEWYDKNKDTVQLKKFVAKATTEKNEK